MLIFKNPPARSVLAAFSILCCVAGCSPQLGAGQLTDEEQADASATDECLDQLWYADVDGDGFGDASDASRACEQPIGRVGNSNDCDDQSEIVNPWALEVCGDAIDNDCSGSDPCQDSLLAHWDFREISEGVVSDASGNGRTIELLNGSAVTSESVIRFDGIDDYAEADHDAGFALKNGTVAFWALSNATATRQGLWSKDSDGLDAGGHLQIEFREDDRLQVRLQSPTTSVTVESAPVPREEWHHIAFSFGEKGMRLYIDGSLAAFDAYAGGIENNSEPIGIGTDTHKSDDGLTTPTIWPLSGEMADVRMYARALAVEEISDIFAIDAR